MYELLISCFWVLVGVVLTILILPYFAYYSFYFVAWGIELIINYAKWVNKRLEKLALFGGKNNE